MAVGNTTTSSLADSLNKVIAAARNTREYDGVMPQLVDKVTLGKGDGTSWHEVQTNQLTAEAVSETEEYDNPQQITDTLFSITPTVIGCQTILTDRVKLRISGKSFTKLGQLAQQAIQRKKDEDGITVLDGATTSLCGAGVTLASGYIAAAVFRISSNTTEPGPAPYRCVLHGFQMKDLYDELVVGVGLAPVSEGPTADVFKNGFKLPIAGCEVYEDGNITPDASDDAKGGVFSKEAIVLVQGRSPWTETERRQIGGGADSVWVYDEYAYGERSAGNWIYEIYSDATAPTS